MAEPAPSQVAGAASEAESMGRSLRCLVVLVSSLAGFAVSAGAQAGGMCGPSPEPVLLVLVASAPKVAPAAVGLSKAPRLVSTADTVIYADGRAVTSDLASISQHLNELGWASRPIEIAGAGTSTRLPPTSTTRRRG
jgi:hypothetical protein